MHEFRRCGNIISMKKMNKTSNWRKLRASKGKFVGFLCGQIVEVEDTLESLGKALDKNEIRKGDVVAFKVLPPSYRDSIVDLQYIPWSRLMVSCSHDRRGIKETDSRRTRICHS